MRVIIGISIGKNHYLIISVAKGAALGAIAGGAIGGIMASIDYHLSKGYYRGKCNKEQ